MKNDNGWTFSWTFTTRYIPNIIQEIYVDLLWTIQHMKCSSYTWINISNSMTTKYILALQHPNHIKFEINQIQWHINLLTHHEVCANSNTTCPPQRGMQQLRIELISSTLGHLTILYIYI
jgi:hypothetical protein